MSDLRHRLRADLTAALRERDRAAVRVLRTTLSAIANAEAHPVAEVAPTGEPTHGVIAGAVAGVAATDVDRRELGIDELRSIVAAERDERLAAADEVAARGALEAAGTLRAEADLLARYLG